MTNEMEMVNGVLQPMSDAEQAIYNAEQTPTSAQLLASLSAHATSVRTGGTSVTVSGTTYNMLTDGEDSMDFMGAFILASGNSGYSADVKTATGYVTMNAATILSVGALVAAWVTKCRAAEDTVAATVANYSTPAAITAAFDSTLAGL